MTPDPKPNALDLVWYAVRIKRSQSGAIRTVRVGGDFETYRDRSGLTRRRRKTGTGKRVFVPELLLQRAGFEVFLPVKNVLRRKNRFCLDCERINVPLLVDWMFVGWPAGAPRWHELMRLDVVLGVMGTGGRPVAVPGAAIQKLMRQWGGGVLSVACHRYMTTGQVYQPGDVARIAAGSFAGFSMEVVEIGAKTARGLVDIFGKSVAIEMGYKDLDFVRADGRADDALIILPDDDISGEAQHFAKSA